MNLENAGRIAGMKGFRHYQRSLTWIIYDNNLASDSRTALYALFSPFHSSPLFSGNHIVTVPGKQTSQENCANYDLPCYFIVLTFFLQNHPQRQKHDGKTNTPPSLGEDGIYYATIM